METVAVAVSGWVVGAFALGLIIGFVSALPMCIKAAVQAKQKGSLND